MGRCPGDIDAVVAFVKRTNGRAISNDEIIERAGGTPKEWFTYLKGPIAQAVIYAANPRLNEDNKEMVSLGHHSETWKTVTCAEARAEEGYRRTRKAPRHLLNAQMSFWAVVQDTRAEEPLLGNAVAWLKLFNEDRYGNWGAFREWSEELLGKLGPPDKEP